MSSATFTVHQHTIDDAYQPIIIIHFKDDLSSEIKFTPDYKANEPVFSTVFKYLSKNNNGLVAYDKLQERLISTGKFDSGESVLMIEYMEKSGKIQKTGDYNIYKIAEDIS
jgi:hypothetical protein